MPGALPFVDEDEIGRDLVERLEQMRKRLGRGLLQRHHADVGVIEPEVGAVAFERRITDVVVEKRVLPEAQAVGFGWRVIEEAPKERERLAFREDAGPHGVLELEDEGLDLVSQLHAATLDRVVQTHDRASAREPLASRGEGGAQDAAATDGERLGVPPRLGQNDEVELHGVPVGLCRLQERAPPPEERIDGRIRMRVIRERDLIPLQHVLVEARVVIPEPKRDLEAPGHGLALVGIQTFVVDPA